MTAAREPLPYENSDEARPDRGEAERVARGEQVEAVRPPQRHDEVDDPRTDNARGETRPSTGTRP